MKKLVSKRRFELVALAISASICVLHFWAERQLAIGLVEETGRHGLANSKPGSLILRALHGLEGRAIDQKFKVRGPKAPHPDVVVVEVDEKSAQKYGLWPWPRNLIAQAIRRLHAAQVRAVALDMIFTDFTHEPGGRGYAQAVSTLDDAMGRSPPDAVARLLKVRSFLLEQTKSPDVELAEALAQSPEVVQGVTLYPPSLASQFAPKLPEQIRVLRSQVIDKVYYAPGVYLDVDLEKLTSWKNESAQVSIPILAEQSRRFGHINAIPDSDGQLRRTGILSKLEKPYGFLPSLEVQAAAAYYDAKVELDYDRIGQTLKGVILVRANGPPVRIPLQPGEPFTLINHSGPGKVFPHVSLGDVLDGTVGAETLKGKLALVGVTLVGNFDQRVTPFSEYEPGIFTHASFASNILSQDYLVRPGGLVLAEIAAMLAIGVFLGWLLPRIRFRFKPFWVAFLLGLWLFVDQQLFNHSIHLATVLPWLNILSCAFGIIFVGYVSVDREKGALKGAFQHYLNESVMEQMLQNPDRLKLGGEKKEMTVLFSDIRGFTTLSERMTPEALVKFINSYLTPMTQIVFDEGGTLDKYIGDALMAFWGAPLDQADHALRACRAAVRFLGKLAELKQAWRDENLPEFDIGVGINSGQMIVGNMGSDIRFDYTVMGDAVNLASRLEGTNKEYETRILISEATFLLVAGQVVARRLGGVRVKGKRKPVFIYELRALGQAEGTEAEGIRLFEAAVEAYAQRRFEEAALGFEQVLKLWPEDAPSRRYLAEIAIFRQQPPGPHWDGVYTATTK